MLRRKELALGVWESTPGGGRGKSLGQKQVWRLVQQWGIAESWRRFYEGAHRRLHCGKECGFCSKHDQKPLEGFKQRS